MVELVDSIVPRTVSAPGILRRRCRRRTADLSPEAKLAGIRAALETESVHSGPTAGRTFLAAVAETWTEITFELERILGTGPKLVAMGRFHGSFRETGTHLDQRIGLVYTIGGGEIQEVRAHSDPADALEAAGLSE